MLKKNTATERSYVYLLTFAYAVSTFATGILMPIYAFFVQKIGGGIFETSWAIGIYSILFGLGTIIIHKNALSHKYRMTLLWVGWLLWLMSMFIYFLMSTILVLYLSQIINALGDALYEPVFDAEFSKHIAADPDGGWAFFNGTTSIFAGVASILGGFIAIHFGFEMLLYCVIGTGIVSFLLIAHYAYMNGKGSL